MFGWTEGRYGVRFGRAARARRQERRGVEDLQRLNRQFRAPCQLFSGVGSAAPRLDPAQAAGGAAGAAEIKALAVATESTDTVTADTGELVAKLPHMRGAVDSRTIAGEFQRVHPPYQGGIVIAAKVEAGAAGLPGIEWAEIGTRLWVQDLTP